MTDEEAPHLAALGAELEALRRDAGLTLKALGEAVTLTPGHLSALERGRRRTRRSTLERLANAVVVDEDRRPEVVEHLVEVAGPALAPESQYADRVARRLARRAAKAERYRREAAAAFRQVERDAGRLSPSSPLAADGAGLRRAARQAREDLERRGPEDLVPASLAEQVRTVGLTPDQRAGFERLARGGPNEEVARALIALDDERLAS